MLNYLFNNGKKVAGTRLAAQLLFEAASWVRTLDFFKQENSNLKTRLSEVVDLSTDKEFVTTAEHFQNQFLLKDEFIDEITRDVKHHQNHLQDLLKKSMDPEEKTIKKQQKLRNELIFLEKNFGSVKHEFNKYLSNSL